MTFIESAKIAIQKHWRFYIFLIVITSIVSWIYNRPATETPSNESPATPATSTSVSPTAQQLIDANYLSSHYETVAKARCLGYSALYLQQHANYQFRFIDPPSSIEDVMKFFDAYSSTIKAPGILTLATDRVELQNGFGAWKRITLYCDYDTQKDTSPNYSIVDQ